MQLCWVSADMKSVIERYHKMKGSHQLSTAAAELELWQGEAANLRQHLQHLQESHRKFMGQEVSGLGVKDLQDLENQLETSLKRIRNRKGQIFSDEIKELNQRGTLIHQENIELYKQVKLMQEENSELQTKVNGPQEVNQMEQNAQMSCNDKNSYQMTASINLQLSQPKQQDKVPSERTMKLSLQFH